MRYTSSAPRVNQMRCLSSVALAKGPGLRLAGCCSAADAMRYSVGVRRRPTFLPDLHKSGAAGISGVFPRTPPESSKCEAGGAGATPPAAQAAAGAGLATVVVT